MIGKIGLGAALLTAGITAAMMDTSSVIAEEKSSAMRMHPQKGVTVKKIFDYPIAELPGSNGVVVRVDYAPGASSPPHHHPGSVFAYVLDGTIESQVAPGPLVKYKQGEMWYEEPKAVHKVSRNASKTAPASLLAFMIVPNGSALVTPEK